MSTLEFEAWPKIARLNRGVIFTEKIDGTNAAVVIVGQRPDQDGYKSWVDPSTINQVIDIVERSDGDRFAVFAQSRSRFITPQVDNHGFAHWVKENAGALVETLGAGTHFGEWWGSGIQRGYGLKNGDKRFSLFNSGVWGKADLSAVPGLGVVPVLPFSRIDQVEAALAYLRTRGSAAAPDFYRPEGIVMWHTAARVSFKVTLEGDEMPKGATA